MSSAPAPAPAPAPEAIAVTIDEPSGKAWGSGTVDKMLAINGVLSVTVDPALPSRIMCTIPCDITTAKPLINELAYTVPGVPLQWACRTAMA